MAREGKKYTCETCWWLSDSFTAICTCEDSVHNGEFMLANQSCPYYDEDEGKGAEKRER